MGSTALLSPFARLIRSTQSFPSVVGSAQSSSACRRQKSMMTPRTRAPTTVGWGKPAGLANNVNNGHPGCPSAGTHSSSSSSWPGPHHHGPSSPAAAARIAPAATLLPRMGYSASRARCSSPQQSVGLVNNLPLRWASSLSSSSTTITTSTTTTALVTTPRHRGSLARDARRNTPPTRRSLSASTAAASSTPAFPPTPSYPRLGLPHNDLKLRCTVFDRVGHVTTIAGEFSKSELCAQHGLQVRDLRKIDSLYINQLPAILVRKHVILVNIAHIRALIKADTVVLFDSLGSTDSYNQSIFIYDLQEKLRSGALLKGSGLPFEFRALESVLVSVITTLQDEVQVVSNLVTNLLAHLEEKIDRHKLKELLQYSKRMAKFEQKVLNIRDAIVEVLEQDEDLAAMYLSAKESNAPRATNDHEEVELLLETYLKQVEEIANIIAALNTNMRSTEDIVNIMLDAQRNNLMMLELQVNIGMLGLTAGALGAGLFGMNLINHHEAHPLAFAMVTTFIIGMVSVVILISVRKMRMLLRRL